MQYRNKAESQFNRKIKMQTHDVGIMRRTAVAGLITEQSECDASPPTAVIHVLTHDSRAQECPSVGLTQSFECG